MKTASKIFGRQFWFNIAARVADGFTTTNYRPEFSHLVALVFLGIGIAISAQPNIGISGWMLRTYGIESDWLSLLFAVCAAGMAFRPPAKYYPLMLTPLIAYSVIAVAESFSVPGLSSTMFWHFLTLVIFIVLSRERRIGPFGIRHVWSFCIMGMGMSIFQSPDAGVQAYIFRKMSEVSLPIPGQTLGVIMMVSSLMMAYIPSPTVFIFSTMAFFLYSICDVFYSFNNPYVGPAGSIIAVFMLMLVYRMYIQLREFHI